MSNSITLRGLTLSKFSSIGDFAKAIGWTRNKASRLLNGQQELSVSEIEQIVQVLDIDTKEMFFSIFFASLSRKWTA